MESYSKKKLSAYSVNSSPSEGDLIPSIVSNGDGTFYNTNIPYSTLRGAPGEPGQDGSDGLNGQGVPTGGTSGQVLKKNSATSFDTSWGNLNKDAVGLGNVDNTSDMDKPVSTAIQSAIDLAISQSKEEQHPIGSIYINSDDSTNPGTLLGFGTWVAFGSGKVPVGFDSSDTDFNAAEKTGGIKETRHGFIEPGINSGKFQDTGSNYIAYALNDISNYIMAGGSSVVDSVSYVRGAGGTVRSDGGSNIEVRHSRYTAPNLQPYITVYMWKRTA